MKTLKMLLPTALLIAGCAVPAANSKPSDPSPASLQAEIMALQNSVTALKATVNSQAAAINTLQSTASSQGSAISSVQAELASPAARNTFALGNYVTVDTTDATIKGVKAPNIIFSGANIHIVSGANAGTVDKSGLGNLVIGYDDDSHATASTDAARYGSNNLMIGDENTFTSSGGLVAGNLNSIGGNYASASGGDANIASGQSASVSGGSGNTASGNYASVSGGAGNTASGKNASVSGGETNLAKNNADSVSGGANNSASGGDSSIGGGNGNQATASAASVSGGNGNIASGNFAAVAGGKGRDATTSEHIQAGNTDFTP